MPDARGGDEVGDRHRPDQILFAHLVDGEHERDEGTGDRRRARAAVGLNDVAVERDRPLPELLQLGDRSQRSADQSLNLLRAAADLPGRGLALRARGRGARQHAVFGCDPPLAGITTERRHAILDAGRADHFRLAGFDQHRTFGVNQVVGSDTCGSELFREAAVCSHVKNTVMQNANANLKR